MARRILLLGLFLLASCLGLHAVENASTGTYNETAPTSSNIANWLAGWMQPTTQPTGTTSTTGWNYVGTLGNESGTYLGNGWVITCAHVGAGDFVLNGVTYPQVPNSTVAFTDVNNGQSTPADFILFRISPYPNLPALPLRQTDPLVDTSMVAMIGYGDPTGQTNVETWGYNKVTQINQQTERGNTSWYTNDFWTLTLSDSSGGHNFGNLYQTVSNDSGGGDFIYNSTTGQWELAGINEVAGGLTWSNGATQQASGLVQLDQYAAQIAQIVSPDTTDTPTLPPWALTLMGGLLVLVATRAVLFAPR